MEKYDTALLMIMNDLSKSDNFDSVTNEKT